MSPVLTRRASFCLGTSAESHIDGLVLVRRFISGLFLTEAQCVKHRGAIPFFFQSLELSTEPSSTTSC